LVRRRADTLSSQNLETRPDADFSQQSTFVEEELKVMLEIRGEAATLCDGVPRRSFLRIGSLGLAGLSLADTLEARGEPGAGRRRADAVILLFMAGGPSHLDTYDMKPDAPADVRGPFRPIRTRVPGLEVSELLPRHVPISPHLSVIRSLTHELSVHDDGTHWLQTGHPLLNARARGQQHPSQGSVVSALRGPNRTGVPAYACVPDDYMTHMGFYEGPAFLGARHAAFSTGADPSVSRYRRPDFLLPVGLSSSRLKRRHDLLRGVDEVVRKAECSGLIEEFDQVQQRAFDIITGSEVRRALDLSAEPDALRDKYGRHLYGYGALLARRLVEAGVTFITVNLYEKDVDWWDDHYTIEKNLRKRLPVFDAAFSTLIEDLHERGLLATTLVAAFGEFGRAPRIDAQAGRGHWPRAMSAVLAGGGIREGQVVGATTADGGEPSERALPPGSLLATMYELMGIDPTNALTDREGKQVRLFDRGEPIRELLR
jgi:hypothetical protein